MTEDYRIGDPLREQRNKYDFYPMTYGDFEAPNGCSMDAIWQAGSLTVEAHPPEWARPEYVAESHADAARMTRFNVGWPHDANKWLRSFGVKETVFSEECEACGLRDDDADCIYCGRPQTGWPR